MNNGPLAGIKVIEIAAIGPAPCTGMMLADMGAEVILVERKRAGNNSAEATMSLSSDQTFFHRGKQSIAVDLKDPAGVDLVLKLVEQADVLIEGFRPGVMERLGLGPDICQQKNEQLIYGRMTGWGQTGPLAQAAGHEPNYVALAGGLWYGGRQGQPPTAPLTLVGDLGGGAVILAWGILCAVIERGKSGKGQVIDAAITDGTAYISSLLWALRNTGQLHDEREQGWADGASPWNDTYACADGQFITICSLEPQFYQLLMEKLELTGDPLFINQWDKRQWPAAKARMKEIFLQQPQSYWCDLMEGSDVCFAPVLSFADAPQHPHNQARDVFLEINGVIQPAPAPKFSSSKPEAGSVPKSGEHTDQILRRLSISESDIARLKDKRVV